MSAHGWLYLCMLVQTTLIVPYIWSINILQTTEIKLCSYSLKNGLLSSECQWKINAIECHPINVTLPSLPVPKSKRVADSAHILIVSESGDILTAMQIVLNRSVIYSRWLKVNEFSCCSVLGNIFYCVRSLWKDAWHKSAQKTRCVSI